MRDPDIVHFHTDDRGIHFQCIRTSAEIRAEFPWMSEYLWGARHPNGSTLGMGVGPSEEAAREMLIQHYPELGRKAA